MASMTISEILIKVILPLVGIAGLYVVIRKIIPDTNITGTGCGGG